LGRKPEPVAASLASGWVDLPALGASGLIVGADRGQKLRELLKGERIQWSTSADGDGVRIDAAVSKRSLQAVPTLFQIFSPDVEAP
jgi:hypothetical protein